MIETRDPFAPHIPKGMTAEQIKEEEERLKRLLFEDELARETGRSIKKILKKTEEQD